MATVKKGLHIPCQRFHLPGEVGKEAPELLERARGREHIPDIQGDRKPQAENTHTHLTYRETGNHGQRTHT